MNDANADNSSGESLQGDVILMCDPTPEGEAIAQELRGLGFSVPTALLPIIEVRMLEESPRMLLIDIDQPAAVETIERMRELPDGAALMLVALGDSKRADELRDGYAKCFGRPVNMAELLAFVTSHADPTKKAKKTQPSVAPPPPSGGRAPDTVPPATRDSEAPEPEHSDRGGNIDPFDIASILPGSLEGMSSGPALSTQLSPELEQLMLSAERRLGSHIRSTTMPPPDAEDLILAPDLLMALDEPLEPDEEGAGTGPVMTTRSLAMAKRARPSSPHSSGPISSHGLPDSFRDSVRTPPAETDPMQPSRSPRSYSLPPSGPPSRRRGPDEDTATEGPVSRDSITPVERRGAASTRTIDPKRWREAAAPPATSAPKTTAAEPPPAPARSQQAIVKPPIPVRPPPPVPEAPNRAFHDARAQQPPPTQAEAQQPAHAKPTRPVQPTPPSPLSIVPGSTYSTRSSGMRLGAETIRPASTGVMTDAMRRAPSTAASPAPMPASIRGQSRFGYPYVATAPPTSIPPAPRLPSGHMAHAPRASTQERAAPTNTRRSVPPPESTSAPTAPELAPVLGEGDAALVLAQVVASRSTGSLALNTEGHIRRIVLQDGDIMTAASWSPDETLLAFLAARGDIDRDVAARFENKLPPFGRHAGAALIAHGHLGQDDLWPVLRAHAEWIIGHAVLVRSGTCELEPEPPGRLKAEPNVFGGATGAEVLLETVRRVVPSDTAMRRVGGRGARVNAGQRTALLSECALRREEEDLIRAAQGRTVAELLDATDPEFVSVLYGLACLGVIELYAAPIRPHSEQKPSTDIDPLDEEAVRQRVRARLALVEDGDYFSLIGVARTATNYEVRRAYLELRRTFEPARLLTAATADLHDDVRLVIEVLDEAYDILREPHRRERYRKAIESPAPH